MQTKPERRRAPRAAFDIPIHLSPRGDARPARLVNLSTSGLCCHFEEAMTEMTVVGIELELPGQKAPARVEGAVVRCAKVPDRSPATYELGVFFTGMSDATRAAIDACTRAAP